MSEAGRRRAWQIGAVGLFAAIVAAVLVLVLNASTDVDLSSLPAQAKRVEATFGGIPQSGVDLGRAGVPATLVEYVDPQCPFCGEYSRDVLPTVVRRYVQTGRLRLRMELLTILGPDSERMASLAAAASLQDRGWQLMELLYENQGDEGSHYATDQYLRKIAEATPGLDAPAALKAADGPQAQRVLDESSRAASGSGVESTPRFFVERPGQSPAEVQPSDLTPEAFAAALNAALPRERP
jgi:protein-disulfide isomerase